MNQFEILTRKKVRSRTRDIGPISYRDSFYGRSTYAFGDEPSLNRIFFKDSAQIFYIKTLF